MFQSVSAFIGMRYARASAANHFIAFINLFSVSGIALGLMALITVSSVMNGFESQLKTRILGLMPHILVGQPVGDTTDFTQLPGVVAQSSMIETEGVMQSAFGLRGVLIQGMDPAFIQQHSIINDNMLYGRPQNLQSKAYRVIIGQALATQLNLRIGDEVRMLTADASVFTPLGRMPSQRLFSVAGIYDLGSELDARVVMIHIDDAARLLRKRVAKAAQTRLVLEDAFEYQQVEHAVEFPTRNWRVRQGPLFDAVKMEKNMMALMLVLIISVAAFNIVSALVMVVTEKQGDIAILRTQGMTGAALMGVFLYNGLYNGLKGSLLGLLGGILLVSQINTLLAWAGSPLLLGTNGQGLPIEYDWLQIGTLTLFSLALCFLASVYPAYRALKVAPAEALKYE